MELLAQCLNDLLEEQHPKMQKAMGKVISANLFKAHLQDMIDESNRLIKTHGAPLSYKITHKITEPLPGEFLIIMGYNGYIIQIATCQTEPTYNYSVLTIDHTTQSRKLAYCVK